MESGNVFSNVFDKERQKVLSKILENNLIPSSYLAGGTALAIQIGHRFSYDFDFFTQVKFNTEHLEAHLMSIGDLKTLYIKNSTFHGILDGINVTWLYYPNPLLEKLISHDQYPFLKIASITDIGIMKLTAISSRGAKRDFVDLYFICKQGIQLNYLFSRIQDKFPNSDINTYHILQSLFYFQDADDEMMPEMISDVAWDDIKMYFLNQQQQMTDFITNEMQFYPNFSEDKINRSDDR